MTPTGRLATSLVLCLGMAGCDNSPSDPGPTASGFGAVLLVTSTSGEAPDIDRDGYGVSGLASPAPLSLRVNDTLLLSDIPVGTYLLILNGVQSNCVVPNGTERSIRVHSDTTIEVSWSPTCGLIPSSLDLTFSTTTLPDIGALSVTIDAGPPVSLRAGVTRTFDSLAPGVHTVAIIDSTPNCQTSAPRTQQITLVREVPSQLDLPGSCSGGRLLFTSAGSLWMMNADTSDLHSIPLPTGVNTEWAALSPDGNWIAFASFSWELYVMRTDGTDAQRIAAAPTNPKELVWSPDGSKIALSGGAAPLYDYEIFVINRDGSDLRNVTADPNRDENPTWSPDGQQIAFASDRAGGSAPWTERSQVFKMDVDGSGIVPLSGPNGFYPGWAPDGSVLAFSRNGSVHTMAPDGTDEQGIPGVWVYLDPPKWSPDSKMLAASNGSEIHFINREGGSVVVTTPLQIRGLSWGP